ncbi:hypothetical protein CH300_03615 [Rhodococcus sp. 15-1154-1]|nr:hypothetical protein CH300_03615 [Rhodococcus sp. 15-1154-1]
MHSIDRPVRMRTIHSNNRCTKRCQSSEGDHGAHSLAVCKRYARPLYNAHFRQLFYEEMDSVGKLVVEHQPVLCQESNGVTGTGVEHSRHSAA